MVQEELWGNLRTRPHFLLLSVLGLAIIWLGVIWQRREAEWSGKLCGYLPAALRELIEARE